MNAASNRLAPLIMAVEGNPAILKLLGLLLTDDGYRTVLHPLTGWRSAWVMQQRPDAIVLGLPAGDDERLQLLEAIAVCPIAAHTPLILISWSCRGLAERLARYCRERLTVAGALLQPFDLEELSALLRDALHARSIA